MQLNRLIQGSLKLFAKSSKSVRRQRVSPTQATLFLVGVTMLSDVLSARTSKNGQKYYKKQILPVWPPPGWVFGPAWTLINIFLTQGAYRLLNKPDRFPHRRELLTLQGFIWFVFVTFSPVYFRLHSPVLAHLWTQSDALAATQSYLLARKSDSKLANSYLPLTAWTWFASTVSGYQALYNPDPVFGTPAPLLISKGSKPVLEKQTTIKTLLSQ